MTKLAIIGGSGFDNLADFFIRESRIVDTPFGKPSSPLYFGELFGLPIVFLPRHGDDHAIPPHKINYRANIYALKETGITEIIALAAVGGITSGYTARTIALPHQIIDYTWCREHTFYDGDRISGLSAQEFEAHIDFTEPFDEDIRLRIIEAAKAAGVKINANAVYAATQGPRLETAAEIDRLERDGADVVGMTVMPESALAREIGIAYASLALVVNAAAGRGPKKLEIGSIYENLAAVAVDVLSILRNFN